MIVGYVRATFETVREEQRRLLVAEGVRRIYSDSGPATALERPTLAEAVSALSKGDALCTASVSVLAANAAALVNVLDQVRARDAELLILDLGGSRMDSSTAAGKLMARMLCAVATFESEAQLERCGTRFFGRQAKARDQRQSIMQMKADGVGATETARQLYIIRQSVYDHSHEDI